MENPEEKTVKYYDIVYEEWINEELTNKELDLIKSLVGESASILDVGSGSGRHSIPLTQAGYKVVGVEPLQNMIALMRAKDAKVPVINNYFMDAEIKETYDLVICFWNTIGQIAQTEEEAETFLKKTYHVTKPTGKTIIGSQTIEEAKGGAVDSSEFLNFEYTKEHDGYTYNLTWKVQSYDEQANTTTSTERIVKKDENGRVIDDVSCPIKQKWWAQQEIKDIAVRVGFKTEIKTLPNEEGFYYILSK